MVSVACLGLQEENWKTIQLCIDNVHCSSKAWTQKKQRGKHFKSITLPLYSIQMWRVSYFEDESSPRLPASIGLLLQDTGDMLWWLWDGVELLWGMDWYQHLDYSGIFANTECKSEQVLKCRVAFEQGLLEDTSQFCSDNPKARL